MTRSKAEQDFLVDWIRTHNIRMKAGADNGLLRITRYGIEKGYSIAEVAYNIRTAAHETALWMQPIREGAIRHGPNYTDAQARAAVRSAMAKGLITNDYVTPIKGQSYYGRGLVQITWLDNYAKYSKLTGKDLVGNPDLVLEWDTALFIMYDGIHNGRFRRVNNKPASFRMYVPDPSKVTRAQFSAARNIVNGDVRKIGAKLSEDAMKDFEVLNRHYAKLKAEYAPVANKGSYDLASALWSFWNLIKR